MSPEEIKRIRASLGLRQQQLAELLGVDRVAVARWETGARNISQPITRLLLRIWDERLKQPRRRARRRDKKRGQERRG